MLPAAVLTVKNMGKYVVKRILLMIMTFFIITTMCFILIKLLPLPAVKEQGRDVELILARREAMGYNKPILVQYMLFWKHILFYGDFGLGEQLYSGQEVSKIVLQKIHYCSCSGRNCTWYLRRFKEE